MFEVGLLAGSLIAIHCFFLLAAPFVSRVTSFTYDVGGEGSSLDV